MIVEGILAIRREEIEEFATRFGGEACADADMLQTLRFIVQAEQE